MNVEGVTSEELEVCDGFLGVLVSEVEVRMGSKPSFSIILFDYDRPIGVECDLADIITVSMANKWIKSYFEIHKQSGIFVLFSSIKNYESISVTQKEEKSLVEALCRFRSNLVTFIELSG